MRLKNELWEDTQIWRQDIAQSTVHEIVNSLQDSLLEIYNDVDKLKTTIKELVTFSAKQAEIMDSVCKKVLSEQESKELRCELECNLPKYDAPSPTPSTFQAPTPSEELQHQEKDMQIDDSNHERYENKEKIDTSSLRIQTRIRTNSTNLRESHFNRTDERTISSKDFNSADHFNYLKMCWNEQIDLPSSSRLKKDIYSFKNSLVATGYDKIVFTWQGVFYEVSEDDIKLRNLLKKNLTESGVSKWVTEGVTVFKWESWYRHILRPHRFAMIPPTGHEINWSVFRPDKYYVHVYQTKIERSWNDLRTLHSRSIAKQLNENWGQQYWPRSVDVDSTEIRKRKIDHRGSLDKTFQNRRWLRSRQQIASDTHTRESNLSSKNSISSRKRREKLRKNYFKRNRIIDRNNSTRLRQPRWGVTHLSNRRRIQTPIRKRRGSWASLERQSSRTNTIRYQEARRRTRRADFSENEQSNYSVGTRGNTFTGRSRYEKFDDLTNAIKQMSKDISLLKSKLNTN